MEKKNAAAKLEKAYFDMLEEMHYSRITVSDVIRATQVSRTTFYRHYQDIFDMHKKIADKLAGAIIEVCARNVINSRSEDEYFDAVLEVFNTQRRYILLLSGENGSRYFFEALLLKAHKFLSGLGNTLSDDQIFRIRFMAVAMVGTYVRDILEDRPHNPKYIELCKKLVGYENLIGGSYADRR